MEMVVCNTYFYSLCTNNSRRKGGSFDNNFNLFQVKMDKLKHQGGAITFKVNTCTLPYIKYLIVTHTPRFSDVVESVDLLLGGLYCLLLSSLLIGCVPPVAAHDDPQLILSLLLPLFLYRE